MGTESSEQYVLLTRLADEYAARYRAGERPVLQEYIDRHPDLADEIRELFPAMVDLEQAKEDHQEAVEQAAPLASIPLEQLGDFRIIREVGKGGMGIVYEAEQVSLGRHVALKVLPKNMLLDAKAKQRFEREAKAAAKLHHTNIVPVFGVGEQDGMPFYVMQFIQGLGLDEVLDELKKLQLANVQPGTFTGSELRVSRHAGQVSKLPGEKLPAENSPHPDLSAVQMAQALLTCDFHAMGGKNDEEAGALPPHPALSPAGGEGARSRGFEDSAPATHPGSSSNSLSLSPSSVVLPGRSRDGSKSKHRKQTYWHSVANVGVQVAHALEYAHKQGIHHRDIKPSNLLLDTQGTVWVTDFGLAKAEDQRDLTHTGDILGTLRYMPPEAFEGKADARGDVYSLGLTLYEMLVFRPAFDESDRHRLIKQVTHEDPDRLRRLNRQIPQDLETIVHKAIDKEAGRRYATAGALAEDLQRFIDDEPIKARRQTQLERYLRWARRHPGIAVLGAVLTAVLVLVTAASLVAAGYFNRLRLNEAEAADEARRQGEAERWQRYRSNLAAAGSAWQLESSDAARRSLEAAPVEYRDWEWQHFQSRLDEARLVLHVGGPTENVVFSPDGKQVAAGTRDNGAIRAWDAASGREIGVLQMQGPGVRQFAFSPGSQRLLVFQRDGTLQSWSPETRDQQVVLRVPYGDIQGDTISLDQRLLVNLKEHVLELWEIPSRCKRADLPGRVREAGTSGVAFTLDGRWLAYSADDKEDHLIRLWNLKSGAVAHILRGHSGEVMVFAFSPDGKRLASGGAYPDNSVRLWDVATGNEIAAHGAHKNAVASVAFSPDGSRFVSASLDQTARLWDGVTGREIATLRGHRGQVNRAVFNRDGRRLVTASQDGTLRLWDAASGEPLAVLHGHAGAIGDVTFSPDGEWLASASNDGNVRLWDMALAERSGLLRGHTSYVYDAVFSPDGSRAASAAWDGTVRLWDPTTCLETGQLRHVPRNRDPKGLTDALVVCVCYRRDGKQLATATGAGQLRVWDAASGKLLRTLHHPGGEWRLYPRLAFHPNGTMLASGSVDGLVRLWDAVGDDPVATLAGHEGTVGDVVFRPDGKQLASTGVDATVRLWDVDTRRPVAVLRGHSGIVERLAYSKDGRLLASASQDRTVRLWDSATGELLSVLPHGSIVYGVAFRPDGTRLAAGCADNTIRLWDVGVAARAGGKEAPEAEVAELRGHDAYVHAVDWSPDGTRLISASGDFTVRIWDSLSVQERAALAIDAGLGKRLGDRGSHGD
jgi:WD40 repeat protein/serine/threonine protein kinase